MKRYLARLTQSYTRVIAHKRKEGGAAHGAHFPPFFFETNVKYTGFATALN